MKDMDEETGTKKESRISYNQARPIEPRIVTAWILEAPPDKKILTLWHKDATIEEVHEFCKLRYHEFRLTALGVGGWEVKVEYNSYIPDARYVDQDWKIAL